MPAHRTPSASQGPTPPSRSLLERVHAQVRRAGRALERRDQGLLPGLRPAQDHGEASTEGRAPVPSPRELRALRLVYHTLGRTHLRHREQTGEPVPPALKAAARAFKREPSVSSLVPVAGFLDDLGLLKW